MVWGTMAPSHTTHLPSIVLREFYSIFNQKCDSKFSWRASINNDCDFMVGGPPRKGDWLGIVAPAVRPTGQHNPAKDEAFRLVPFLKCNST